MSDTSAFLFSSQPELTDVSVGSFSVAFWFRPGTGPTYVSTTLLIDRAWDVRLNTDGTVRFTINDSATSTSTSVDSSEVSVGDDWNFVVVIYDAVESTITVSVNGVSDSNSFTDPADFSTSSLSPNFQIGTDDLQDSATISASFDMDSVTVWARVLTVFEVTTLYNSDTGLDYPFMGGIPTLIFQASLINDPPDPLVLGLGFQLWSSTRSFDSTTGAFQANMDLLYSGNPVTTGFPWIAENFFDKIVFAQHDNPCQYWQPPLPALARPLPGLPSSDSKWDGITVFFGHVMLWKSDRLKWSDKDDFSLWLPVDTTVVSTILTTVEDFIQPAPGGIVSVTVSDPVSQVISVSLSGNLAFGNVAVGSTAEDILTITNSGNTPLIVSGLALPGGFTGEFSGTIPVNGSVPVVITFAPESAIDYLGVIAVASNATTGTHSYPVSGTGTGTTKTVSLSGILDFGKLLVNHTLQSSLIIENMGNATLNVASLTLPSGFSGTFSGAITSGSKQAVTVTFSPTAALTYSGDITVSSDATSGDGSISVSGIGVTKLSGAIFLTDNGTLQFGEVPTGTTPTGTLTINNPGSNNIHVVGLSLPGGYTGSFSGTISPHSSHDVTITFSPVDGIFYGGVITVAFTNNQNGVNTISVSGTGTETGKVIALSGVLDFGGVLVGDSAQNILKISNTGDADLTVTSITYPTGFSGSFSGVIAPGSSKIILVTFAPTSAIDYSGTVTVNSDKTAGTNTILASGTGVPIPTPTALEPGQFVSIQDVQGGLIFYNFYTVVSMDGASVVLRLLDLTGATLAGLTVTQGHQIFSVNANESGETRIVGAQFNGPILRVIPQGDYAYAFKSRSIHSIQYTGLGNGIFFLHPEVNGEGLLSRNAAVTLNDGRIIFLGHKELYEYNGGPNPIPKCQQTTQQLYAELDRSRLHQVILFNNEQRSEVWVVYPTNGGSSRVMIWNYTEDTASFDDYDAALVFSAFGLVDWSADLSWAQLPQSMTWTTMDSSITWSNMEADTKDHLVTMGSEDGNIRVWGTRYAREGAGYLALSESMDFDLGDGDTWKYVDVVHLGLQIPVPENVSRLLWIQVGCRSDLNDADITWTDPQSILVNGHAETPVKINPGGAGRFLRVRFYSDDPDVRWAVSSFEILARPGGTY